MKSQIIENTGLKRVIKVDLDQSEVTSALEKEFKKIQKNAELKGFRKGKAPMDQIKAMYSSKVSQTVLEELVNENYFNALEEHKLQPIAMPKIDVDQNSSDSDEGGFSFTAEFEVKPEITLKDLTKLSVEKPKIEVTDEQINEVLQKAVESKAEVNPVLEDRPAKMGDWVKIDFEGFLPKENKPVENGSSKDFLLELGGKSLIDGFEEGIVGMKSGEEKTLSLKFPDGYFQNDLAGEPVDFKVKLNSINKKDFPELNDELAKEVSGLESLDAMKKQIKEDLTKKQEQSAEQRLSDDLLNELAKMHNDIKIPESIVDQQAESFKNSTTQRLMQQGMNESSVEEYHKKWEGDYRDNAEKSVKISFLVEALATQEKLYPTQDSINEYFEDLSEKTGIATDKIQTYYGTPEKLRELEFKIMEENVVKFLKDKATIK
jgi:trigger factor